MIILCCLRYCNSHKTITIGNQKLENCSWFKVLENSKTEKCYFHEHWTKNIEQRSVHWDSISILIRLSVILLPPHPPSLTYKSPNSPLATSSETQRQIVGVRESLNGRKNVAQRKVKNGEKSPWGHAMSCETSSKRLPPFWLLIGARKTQVFWHQSEARMAATIWNWSDKTLSPGVLLAVLYFSSRHFFPPV